MYDLIQGPIYNHNKGLINTIKDKKLYNNNLKKTVLDFYKAIKSKYKLNKK